MLAKLPDINVWLKSEMEWAGGKYSGNGLGLLSDELGARDNELQLVSYG